MSETLPTAVVVDDHPPIAEAFRRLWRRRLSVVGTAYNAPSGVAVAAAHSPDVVTMDVQLPGCPWTAIRRIVDEVGSPVVVITGSNLAAIADRALEAGAGGVVPKSCSTEEMLAAVLAVARGEEFIGATWESRPADSCPRLEPTDEKLLHLVAMGLSSAEAAEFLGTPLRTVQRRLQSLRERYEAKTDARLVARAYNCGVLTAGDAL